MWVIPSYFHAALLGNAVQKHRRFEASSLPGWKFGFACSFRIDLRKQYVYFWGHDYIICEQRNRKTLCNREIKKTSSGNNHSFNHPFDSVGQCTRSYGLAPSTV